MSEDILGQLQSIVAVVLISVGVLFDLLGAVGLVRMPDVYCRLQAATKCVTLGTCLILLGVAVAMGLGADSIRALVCAGFVLLTSPVGAHALAKGTYASGIKPMDAVVDKYAGAEEE